jgi:hypothetical protein
MIQREMELAFLCNESIKWEGDPGVGKTAGLQSFFKKHNVVYHTLILSIHEPADVSGQPVMNMNEGTYQLACASWVKKLQAAAAQGFRTALFLDELTTAPPSMQAAALRLIHERVVGDEKLPDDCWIVAACNSPEVAANGYELSPPLANRFTHLKHSFDRQQWVMDFPTYWGEAPEIKLIDPMKWMAARGKIAAFLVARSGQILNFPKEQSAQSASWPSPRTWDKASRYLAVANDVDDALGAIAGCVGHAVALEFVNFLKNLDLPDPEFLLKNPDKFEIPKKRGDITFAILSSLHAALTSKNDPSRYAAMWKILGATSKAGLTDIAICWAKPISGMMPKGAVTPKEALEFTTIMREANIRN